MFRDFRCAQIPKHRENETKTGLFPAVTPRFGAAKPGIRGGSADLRWRMQTYEMRSFRSRRSCCSGNSSLSERSILRKPLTVAQRSTKRKTKWSLTTEYRIGCAPMRLFSSAGMCNASEKQGLTLFPKITSGLQGTFRGKKLSVPFFAVVHHQAPGELNSLAPIDNLDSSRYTRY